MDYKGFNDYSVEVYRNEQKLAIFSAVTNIWFLCLWLNIRYPKWTSIKVFHRQSGTFIDEYLRDSTIPSKPRI
jgi:hypothetical protein